MGRMEVKKKSPIKALVVGEFVFSEKTEMITAVGAYRDAEKAYGAAYLFLVSDLEDIDTDANSAGTPYTVTEPWKLEGETGFGITLKNEYGKTERRAYILFNDQEVEDGTE